MKSQLLCQRGVLYRAHNRRMLACVRCCRYYTEDCNGSQNSEKKKYSLNDVNVPAKKGLFFPVANMHNSARS